MLLAPGFQASPHFVNPGGTTSGVSMRGIDPILCSERVQIVGGQDLADQRFSLRPYFARLGKLRHEIPNKGALEILGINRQNKMGLVLLRHLESGSRKESCTYDGGDDDEAAEF